MCLPGYSFHFSFSFGFHVFAFSFAFTFAFMHHSSIMPAFLVSFKYYVMNKYQIIIVYIYYTYRDERTGSTTRKGSRATRGLEMGIAGSFLIRDAISFLEVSKPHLFGDKGTTNGRFTVSKCAAYSLPLRDLASIVQWYSVSDSSRQYPPQADCRVILAFSDRRRDYKPSGGCDSIVRWKQPVQPTRTKVVPIVFNVDFLGRCWWL
jgi:hypothetical protein